MSKAQKQKPGKFSSSILESRSFAQSEHSVAEADPEAGLGLYATLRRDTAEFKRLGQNSKGYLDYERDDDLTSWYRWGPYLSERQWGTVREDYTENGDAWFCISYEQALAKTFRWGEDGLAGLSDQHGLINFALAVWNKKDWIIKERLFGLNNGEGNHGEDVKEYYYYIDSTPTHSYMKYLYKYPQTYFPYSNLREGNQHKSLDEPELELIDTGVFKDDKYWDIFVEYAKETPSDINVKITVHNRGPETAEIDIFPQMWFRNTWAWNPKSAKPKFSKVDGKTAQWDGLEKYPTGYFKLAEDPAALVFTNNETNNKKLYGDHCQNPSPFVKDGFNEFIVKGNKAAVNEQEGTKVGALYRVKLGPGEKKEIKLALSDKKGDQFKTFDKVFADRIQDADDFYEAITPGLADDEKLIQRQAFAGMLWTKQYYEFDIRSWLEGDPGQIKPPASRWNIRNFDWLHFKAAEVLSMPDKWEYPWFAAWDLAFHTIVLAMVDPMFAKNQLLTLTSETHQHPRGTIPAYEWNYNDINPPVHVWAVYRVFKIEENMYGHADYTFLKRAFAKLLLNFTWWVNVKDPDGNNVFEGGFLGLDNIGVFDRNLQLPDGQVLEQADATAWMGFYCVYMFVIAIQLALVDPSYEEMSYKFFNHYMDIVVAINRDLFGQPSLWNEQDGFYYDAIRKPDGGYIPVKTRSLVGLMPLIASATIEPEVLARFPRLQGRLEAYLKRNPWLKALPMMKDVERIRASGKPERVLLSMVPTERVPKLLKRMLDEKEFLSPFGIRSVSKHYQKNPYKFVLSNGVENWLTYQSGEGNTKMFGGNSNWRGPIWMPINFLFVEALQKYDFYFGEDMKLECPTGSGQKMSLYEVSLALAKRLTNMFKKGDDGKRPFFRRQPAFVNEPYVLFYEYFDADSGAGLGASHQTGWTGLVAKLIDQLKNADVLEKWNDFDSTYHSEALPAVVEENETEGAEEIDSFDPDKLDGPAPVPKEVLIKQRPRFTPSHLLSVGSKNTSSPRGKH